MWIMLPEGIVSVAESPDNDTMLMVRARHRDVLRKVREGCGRNRTGAILHTPERDYQYRVYVKKDIFAAWVAHRVRTIDYSKFKPTAVSTSLHNLYVRVWAVINEHYAIRRVK